MSPIFICVISNTQINHSKTHGKNATHTTTQKVILGSNTIFLHTSKTHNDALWMLICWVWFISLIHTLICLVENQYDYVTVQIANEFSLVIHIHQKHCTPFIHIAKEIPQGLFGKFYSTLAHYLALHIQHLFNVAFLVCTIRITNHHNSWELSMPPQALILPSWEQQVPPACWHSHHLVYFEVHTGSGCIKTLHRKH